MNFLIVSPLEQFEIITLLPLSILNFNCSITNSTLFLAIAVCISLF